VTGFPNRIRYGGDRTSQVPGGPRCERALLSDPGGTSALGRYRASMLSSTKWKASTPTTNTNFGAQSHGLPTRCLRFAGWITPPPRKTRFRMAGQPCPGGSDYPLGPIERFQVIHPPFPGFAWRTQFTASKWGRVASGITPRGSHGSGRADFPHPALQSTVSLRDRGGAKPRLRQRVPLQQPSHLLPRYPCPL
jgi:hypothetical protein